MKYSELTDAVASALDIPKAKAPATIKAIFDIISGELAGGNEVNVAGFGKFAIKNSPARNGRNPSTGESIQIAASKKAVFKASLELKNSIQ